MKKDIFNGKIKKEYCSYILGYMIFFMLLFVVGGALCICAFVSEGSFNVSGERALLVVFGVVLFMLGGGYVFTQLFVIHNFPKYPKLRRIMFNSDIYFTDSTSNEYFGGSRTLRGRISKAAFGVVTAFAEEEKRMEKKKPIRYTVCTALASIMALFGLVDLIVMPLLYENSTVFSNVPQNVFLFCYISVGFVCIALAILFLACAFKVAIMAPLENHKWTYEVYSSLVDISVRQNNKKLKFWYDIDQLEQIESLVKSASENAELKLETKKNKLVSFKVVDNLNQRVIFTGLFL